jgi:hypothetical protein
MDSPEAIRVKKSADFGKIHHLFYNSEGFSKNLRVLAPKSPLGDGGGWLGSHLVPPLRAVNSSSFCLVLLNCKQSGSFSLMQVDPLYPILHFDI